MSVSRMGLRLRRLDRLLGGRPLLVEAGVLMFVCSLAFILRVLPLRWGVALSEFDPWVQYKEALFVIERGWAGFSEFFSWHDTQSWYPWGRDMGRTAFPGIPFTMAFVYFTLTFFGFRPDTLELAAILPVLYGVLTVVAVYFLGKRVGGSAAGLAAALFMSISTSHIGRTHFGWFDDESLSLPLMLAGYIFYLTAINEKRSLRGSAFYALLSGLALGYMAASWGAHKFPLAFVPFFSVVLALIGRYSRRVLVSTAVAFAVYTSIAVSVPKLGPNYIFEITISSGFIAILILAVFEAASRIRDTQTRRMAIATVLLVSGVGFISLAALGVLGAPGIKFLSVILPGLRGELPIVQSVAENQVPTWSIIFSDFGLTLILLPYGVYRLLKTRLTEDLFIVFFLVFSVYFASSMVRLSLMASPAVAIVAGYAYASLFSRVGESIAQRQARKKKEGINQVGLTALTPVVVLLLIIYSLIPSALGGLQGRVTLSPVDQGYQPPTIITSSFPARQSIPDWVRALNWMKDNLPKDAVIASWWDYGYWITIIGEKITLIDNATINTTQIGDVAHAFMSDERTAMEIFRKHNVTHVVIYVTHQFVVQGGQAFGRLLGFGDEGKWIWMLRIANQTGHPYRESEYLDQNFQPTQRFWQTLLGQLIPYKPTQTTFGPGHLYNPSQLNYFRLVYESSPPYQSFAYVYVYEVIYP
ncbi:MAG: STT3 domain-containing protein [Candidatus Caldarchaeum sp.]|uniref:dolichyl-phosphooligosaccharide-protein glycotransferase n=1 Tax=Caldiarchaeum subterraneum TaxID=311458 RepID=A0A7J3VSY3_CALS0